MHCGRFMAAPLTRREMLRRCANGFGAVALTALLAGSDIRMSHLEGDERVQDPYCLRCQPQVMGGALDLLTQAARTLIVEVNAAPARGSAVAARAKTAQRAKRKGAKAKRR